MQPRPLGRGRFPPSGVLLVFLNCFHDPVLTDKPKVAFTVGLGSGRVTSPGTGRPLIYTRVITNVGNGYNSATGRVTLIH